MQICKNATIKVVAFKYKERDLRPTPHFLADKDRMVVYHDRLKKKDWQKKWPRLQILA